MRFFGCLACTALGASRPVAIQRPDLRHISVRCPASSAVRGMIARVDDTAALPSAQLSRYQYPSPLRAPPALRARLPFPRAPAIYDCVARHSKTRFHTRAKKSRSNFPRFDFPKRGFHATSLPKIGPQTDPGFHVEFAPDSPVFCDLHPRFCFPRRFPTPRKRVGNQNRRFSQSHCEYRATNQGRLKGAISNGLRSRAIPTAGHVATLFIPRGYNASVAYNEFRSSTG